MNENGTEITVWLNMSEELFSEPVSDPFDPEIRCRTGLEELLEQMHCLRSLEVRVVVELPPDSAKPDLQERTEAAFRRRYCRAKINESERQLKEYWRQTRRQSATAGELARLARQT